MAAAKKTFQRNVSGTERMVGVAILLILAGIVAAAVGMSVRDEPGLFERDAKPAASDEGGPDDRDRRVARAMLAPLGTAGWSREEDVEVADGGDLPEPLTEYGVRRRYQGCYVKQSDPDQQVAVQIYETTDPPHALGLFGLLTPRDRAPLPAGNGGWVAGDRAGFWAGRYYTQFDRSAVRDEQPSVKVITDALAAVQITYGPPFWAEALLPAAGRVRDSLRYLPVGDPVLPSIDECFAVTYEDGTVALVRRVDSADTGAALLDEIAQQLRADGTLTQAPAAEQTALSGRLQGMESDRHVFAFVEAGTLCATVGPELETVSRIAAEMLERVRPVSGATVATGGSGPDERSPFPALALPGWRVPDNVAVFTATNLWEKINGRADLYLSYNVATLTFGTYRGDGDLALDVYWYDMVEPDNAFGIYQAEYGGYAEPVSVGREAYRAGSSVFFWAGQHYLRIEAAEQSAELTEAAEGVAAAIASAVADDGRPLWADAMLPTEDRVAHSFEYQADSAFGLDFLTQVFCADYETDAGKFKLFVHRAADAAAAQEVLRAYAEFFDEYGKVIQAAEGEDAGLLIGESSGVIDAAFVSGRYLAGANGADDADLAKRKALAFRAALASASEAPPTDR
ncbi:MAG: hypothetical protein GY778_21870 [bacterium]|nr:hypothetical protein [bacterium]